MLGNLTGNVTGDVLGNLTGNVTGNVVGDVIGSIFADDSTMLVDSTNGLIVGDIFARLGGDLNLNGFSITGTGDINITGEIESTRLISSIIRSRTNRVLMDSNDQLATVPITLSLKRTNPTADMSADEIGYGRVSFEKDDQFGSGVTGIIIGGSDFLLISHKLDPVGTNFLDDGSFIIKQNSFGIGTKTPSLNSKLDINGIMKLRLQDTAPAVGEAGMIAVADGNALGWDPKGTDTGIPYPVFHDGTGWKVISLV